MNLLQQQTTIKSFLFSRDPAALESFLRGSSKSVDFQDDLLNHFELFVYFQSTDSSNSQRSSADSNRTTPTNIYNQNTTNNTNVQITQNTFNFNTNPSLLNPSTQQNLLANDSTRVVNQTVGQQTNVNVILNQTVIQQSPTNSTPTATTTTTNGTDSINNETITKRARHRNHAMVVVQLVILG